MSSAPPTAASATSRLGPTGPLATLDRAFLLLRRGGTALWVPSIAGGVLVPATLVLIYYAERVEGITSLRAFFALLLVLAWAGRAVVLGSAARGVAPRLGYLSVVEGPALDPWGMVRVAGWTGLGVLTWALPFVAVARLGWWALVLTAPLLFLRGAVAPSWVARAACVPETAGLSAWVAAAGDTSGRRLAAATVELLVLLGLLAFHANLYAALGLLLGFAQSFLGLDVAFLSSFTSVSNPFVLLLVLAAALVLFEPLRVALAVLYYAEARVRSEGLDVIALADEALVSRPRSGASAVAAGALLAGLVAVWPAGLAAQDQLSSDQRAREDAAEILARDEFQELEAGEGVAVQEAIARFFDALFDVSTEDSASAGRTGPSLPMPPAWVFLLFGAVVVLGVGLVLWLQRGAKTDTGDEATEVAIEDDPRDRPPEAHLDEAARLAQEGAFRDALRFLYVATLVALDRRRWISFDPAMTNWQYLREMPRGDARERFARFTRLFDHKWYGDETTESADYQQARELADRIVELAARRAA